MLVYQRVPTAVGFLPTFGEVVASCKAALHVLGVSGEGAASDGGEMDKLNIHDI